MAWGDAVSRRWRRRDLAPRERRRAPKRHDATRRRDNWTYKGVPMDTSIRDTEGRAPLYLYYEHCYGPFVDREDARRLYEKYPRSESCFRGVDRIKLLMSILSAPTRDGGAGLPLDKLVRRKACDAAFPLHEEDELKSLEARWIRMWARPAQLPSERARPRRPTFRESRVDGVGAPPSRGARATRA